MKSKLLNLIIAVMVILVFSGCFPYKKAAQPLGKNLDETATDSLAPESRYYYFTESQLERKKGNLDKAIKHLNKAIEIDPESLYMQRELAILYLQLKDSDKALNILKKILEKDPDNVQTLILYGKLNQGLKKVDDAEAAYEKVVSIDPTRDADSGGSTSITMNVSYVEI